MEAERSITAQSLDRRPLRALALAIPVLCSTARAFALDFNYSGFGSIVGGQTYGDCATDTTISDFFTAPCTRFIADWAHGGVYTPAVSFKPESKIGLQGTLAFADKFSATAQIVGRFVEGATADLEWAYLTYDASPAWTVQLGRKRLPIYYYSAIQDVGYAYPWVRVPPDIYGWDAVNYNGFNATYRKSLGDWSLKSNLFFGEESTHDSGYAKLSYVEPKNIDWLRIRGVDLELNKEWFTTRFTYIESDYRQIDRQTRTADALANGATIGRQKIYGVSINVDIEAWLMRSEYSVFDRGEFQYTSNAWMVGVGYRAGKWTPMLTASRYAEKTDFPDAYTPVNWTTQSLSLRYDVASTSAIKVQWDWLRDGHNTYAGDAYLISASYDFVF